MQHIRVTVFAHSSVVCPDRRFCMASSTILVDVLTAVDATQSFLFIFK